jgi:hypothetical protein
MQLHFKETPTSITDAKARLRAIVKLRAAILCCSWDRGDNAVGNDGDLLHRHGGGYPYPTGHGRD